MMKPNEELVEFPHPSSRDVLTDVLREGARRLLATAIEAEVTDYLTAREALVDASGHRQVVRNGHLPERSLQTPLGDVRVQQPRVRDRRPLEERETPNTQGTPPVHSLIHNFTFGYISHGITLRDTQPTRALSTLRRFVPRRLSTVPHEPVHRSRHRPL